MSVSVSIRTASIPEPNTIMRKLAERGEGIVVVSDEYPVVAFGNHLEAIRGVEISREDHGVDIHVGPWASVADYRLFAKTIQVALELTGGKAFLEDNDDFPITRAPEAFTDKWIDEQRERDFNDAVTFLATHGGAFIMVGLCCRFCIGPRLLEGFDISLDEDYDKDKMDKLQKYLCQMQWFMAEQKDTDSSLVIPPPPGGEREALSVSLVTIVNGQVEPFNCISVADVFGIMDLDDEERFPPVFIPFEQVRKILPEEFFYPVDEMQFMLEGELTVEQAHQMMERARLYQPADLYHTPLDPGEGFDEEQNTFILKWNPAISNVTLEDHMAGINGMLTADFNWSVWEHEKAKCGDRFFLVRVGEGNTGIVMSGTFTSNPYQDDDWNGKGRPTYYMDMKPNVALNSDEAPYISTERLQEEIPSFEWMKGHSGMMIPKEEARKLEKLWEDFMAEHADEVDEVTMNAIFPYKD